MVTAWSSVLPDSSKIKREIAGQFLRYGAVGLINTLIGGACIILAYAFTHHLILANLFGYSIGFLMSFALNRVWTFRETASTYSINSSLWRFALVSLGAYGVNLVTVVFVNKVLDVNGYIAQLCGLVIYVALGFLGSRSLAFNRPSLAPPAEQK